MPKSQSSLKTKNAFYLWTFVGINFAVFIALAIGPRLDFESVQHVWQRISAKNGFIAAGMPVLVIVLNGILSDIAKARLVFWRWKNPLPGCRAFIGSLHDDPRIDVDRLKKKHGPFPRAAKEQNALWYKLYKKHSDTITVSESHRIYLLTRDMACMAALFVLPFSLVVALSAPAAKIAWVYMGGLFLQYWCFATAARNYGNRFVKNVLTEESQSKLVNQIRI